MSSCAELLRFQLPGHEAAALRSITRLRAEERFCDVTIVARRLRFRGHRVVLAACSPFLRDQFLLHPGAELRVSLAHSARVLTDLLLSCYTGALQFRGRDLVNYLTAASYLQMEHVVERCRGALARFIARYSLAEDGDGEGVVIFPGVGVEEAVAMGLVVGASTAAVGAVVAVGGAAAVGAAVGEASPMAVGASPSMGASTCPEAFHGVEKLVFHMRAHHLVFMCPRCGKHFNHSSNLNRHMNVHRGVKSHACGLCGKSFTQKSTLHDHMNLHSGQRPYRCSYCDVRFAHKPAIRRHLKEQH
uniref:Zinc finger and BTB domain containing 12 n=2 Tax=Amazona TaxID=12929 RepID=A0A8B9G8I2_9PSIT